MVVTAWKNIDTEEMDEQDGFLDSKGGACCPAYGSSKENRERGNWPYGIQGSLALTGGILGSSVIMNSVPYCIRIYGLNFLAPYTIGLFLLSIPLFYLETTMGQFSSRGLLSCWMVPIFKGVGVLVLFVNIPHAVLQGTNAARGLYELHEGVKASLGHNITNEPMTEEGSFNGTLAVALLIVWMLVALISCFGVKAIAWVSSMLVPLYIILMIILAALVNHNVGTEEMWSRWMSTNQEHNTPDAHLSEVAFAVMTAGLATTGIVITYSSYNRFHNDVIKDTAFVFIMKYSVDVLLAVIFMGLSSHDVSMEITRSDKVLEVPEYDWSYSVLADVFEKMTGGSSYAIAYFMMFFFMTLLHVMAILETFVTSFLDELPSRAWLRPVIVILSSIVLYLFSFTMCSVDYRYWEMLLWRNVIIWAVHLVILLMIGCFLVYGIQTYFRHRHDVAAMTHWNLWCIPSVIPWWGATALLLTIVPWIAIVSVGEVARGYFDIDRPPWSSKHVESTLSALFVLVLVVTFIIQLLLAVIWKEPHDWRTLFGSRPSWMPALGKHWARVDHYRNINRYSSNNYSQVAPREQEIPVMDVSKKEQPAQSFYV